MLAARFNRPGLDIVDRRTFAVCGAGDDLASKGQGRRVARMLRHRLKGRPFALVLSSPLRRALETCRVAGYGDVAELNPDLMEWDYRDYEGRRRVDIQKERPGWSLWRDGVPGGETIDQVAARTRRVLEAAKAAEGDVALFAQVTCSGC